jgi:predicted secreted protein
MEAARCRPSAPWRLRATALRAVLAETTTVRALLTQQWHPAARLTGYEVSAEVIVPIRIGRQYK